MSFPLRLKAGIECSGLSIRDIADNIGCVEGTLRKYVKGETEPSLSTVCKLAEILQLSFVWLALGKGAKDRGRGELFAIPYLEEEFWGKAQNALHHVFRRKTEGILFSHETFESLVGYSPIGICWWVMDSDAMASFIWNGNLLALWRGEPGQNRDREGWIPKEGLYAVRFGGNITVRRVQSSPDGKKLHLIPVNSSYQSFEVPREDVLFCPSSPPENEEAVVVVGRVVWVGHRI